MTSEKPEGVSTINFEPRRRPGLVIALSGQESGKNVAPRIISSPTLVFDYGIPEVNLLYIANGRKVAEFA